MTFLHPWLLWLLLLPAALLLAALRHRARAASTDYPKIPRALVAAGRWSPIDARTRFSPRPFAAALALGCLVLALARPQGAAVPVPTLVQARDVLVAVDVSKSMLAEDIAPSRLERARLLIRSLTDALRGERLGLLPFAGSAFLQSPLSADYEIFRSYLDELGPDLIPAGGSDYAALLRTAEDAFGLDGEDQQAADRYLIVLGDGEAQDEAWRPLAEKLADRGVRVIALGLGTTEGAMIPDGQGGFAKDNRGAVVLSRLQADTLRQLAELSGGTYRDASAWLDLPALLAETVERGRAGRVVEQRSERRQELFAWFLAPALLLLLVSLGREFPADPVRRKTTRLTPRPIVASAGLAAALLLQPPAPAPAAEPTTPEPADPLVALVANLASAQSPSPGEWAALANLTAELGEAARAQPGSSPALPEGAIQDALLAVEQGRRAGPGHADWDALRDRLARLLEKPDSPPQSSPQKSENSEKQKDSESSPSDAASSDAAKQQGDTSESQKSDNASSSSDPSKPSDSPSEPGQPQSADSGPSDDQSNSDSAASSSATDPESDPEKNRPAGQQLGELGDGQTPEQENDAPVPAPGTEEPPPPEDTPAQTVGGVSASGRDEPPSGDDSASAATPADATALAVGQRLEQVRSADSPARLFQLMQDANAPRETPRPTQPKQDW